jgi:hypothetical protein
MSYSRFQYFPDVWNDDIQHTQQGIVDTKDLKERIDQSDSTLYEIPLSYSYRPDLISQEFYGTGDLHWVITYINDISDSPQGYYPQRVIKIPNPKRIAEII